MCLLGVVGRPGVFWGVLWCLGVSWGNKTDRLITPSHVKDCQFGVSPVNYSDSDIPENSNTWLRCLVRLQPGSGAELKMASMSEPLHLERGKWPFTGLFWPKVADGSLLSYHLNI